MFHAPFYAKQADYSVLDTVSLLRLCSNTEELLGHRSHVSCAMVGKIRFARSFLLVAIYGDLSLIVLIQFHQVLEELLGWADVCSSILRSAIRALTGKMTITKFLGLGAPARSVTCFWESNVTPTHS